ncbi:N-acetyltransferase [Actinoplanes cyaneus]|uniref:N-acetyltransferase n=1 Tax=Actinoplanes cyaneus TaxID=52696 RepID=A0A919M9K5_9ACTN|nr:GNAT family N-acetyltransferase [Actinoplanes cyaneus]MCW2137076.1 diamine N-acetyltransferase [Actinoplanes cyaneus]GID63126.1 N-acetyltransferase [Actinoplanes cyaneus]
MMSETIRLEPVTAANWRDCAALTVHEEQRAFVAEVSYYLCMCAYGDTWQPVAAYRGDEVVGFAIRAADDDGSRWIGGLVVDARHQRQGIGRELVRQLRERLIAEPGTPNVALSYQPANTGARALYLSMGFVETGEREDDEVVARWTP